MTPLDIKALFKRLNPYCSRSLETAAGVCVSRGNYEVTIEHLFKVMLEDVDADLHAILRHYEVEPAPILKAVSAALEDLPAGNVGKPVFAPLLIELLQEAWLIASIEFQQAEMRSGALVAAFIGNSARYGFTPYFDAFGAISSENLRRDFLTATEISRETVVTEEGASGAAPAPAGDDTALAQYTTDFTAQARAGRIDPVFCRDREIRQMIDILGRRRKNNPIAVGEPGVGKTAVVEGLALRIAEGDIPDAFKDVTLLGLDLGLLQAGAGMKGEFENRLKSVIGEVKASEKPIILFIDEAHTLIGAGGQAGQGDAANLLKPALARGELRTIAATTWSEYKKYFEKDPALARRFQPVKLDEPSPDEAVTIIRGLRDKYEEAHGVYVRDDAIEAAARMSARYISGRQLPDKAVDVLDTAATRVKMSLSAKPDAIDDRERQAATLQREHDALARDVAAEAADDDGRLATLTEEITALHAEAEALTAQWTAEADAVRSLLAARKSLASAEGDAAETARADMEAARAALAAAQNGGAPLVDFEATPDVVNRVISDWTGIPLGDMVKDEAGAVLTFKDRMNTRVKGQEAAIDALDEGVRAAKAGLNNPDAPLGVFLLVGPSGVGKTETGLAIADLLFGGERFMTTINMSEFQEGHSVSRLIGSPPGYVGYGEGGMLTEAVRQRPYSVVLLDEVEKADLEVMNVFYQVFDKGMLSDGEGRLIDFKNTIILLTSNLASDVITAMGAGEDKPTQDQIVEAIRPILSDHFQPALLARMQILPYYPVHGSAMREIVRLKLDKVGRRLAASQDIAFDYAQEVVAAIAERCTEVETGARNIDHIINRNLLPKISTQVLEMMGEGRSPERLSVGLDDAGAFVFAFDDAAAPA
ncbi:MAG: type VI secretion system ATPase TssH [Pseudomonadota bacterium]